MLFKSLPSNSSKSHSWFVLYFTDNNSNVRLETYFSVGLQTKENDNLSLPKTGS